MAIQYNEYIISVIQDLGFETGKELNKKLQKKFSISSDNARKIISRAVAQQVIKSSQPITFGNGQYVYMLKGQVLTKKLY
jgi:hypothetical protein